MHEWLQLAIQSCSSGTRHRWWGGDDFDNELQKLKEKAKSITNKKRIKNHFISPMDFTNVFCRQGGKKRKFRKNNILLIKIKFNIEKCFIIKCLPPLNREPGLPIENGESKQELICKEIRGKNIF